MKGQCHLGNATGISELKEHYEASLKYHLPTLPKFPDSAKERFSLLFQNEYEQLRQCFALSLFGCGMVYLGALVESFLEEAIILRLQSKQSVSEEEKLIIHQMQLKGVISKANSIGIIDDNDKLYLIKFKDKIRNLYNHGNFFELIKDFNSKFTKEIISSLTETGESNIEEITALYKKFDKDVSHSLLMFLWFYGLILRVNEKL